MVMFIILFAVYMIFWIVTGVLIKNYIAKLIDGIRGEVQSIANLAERYFKK